MPDIQGGREPLIDERLLAYIKKQYLLDWDDRDLNTLDTICPSWPV